LPMETLYKRILHRPSWLNMHQVDLPLDPPGQKMPARKLRSVVATNRPRHSALRRLIRLKRSARSDRGGCLWLQHTFSLATFCVKLDSRAYPESHISGLCTREFSINLD